MTTITERDAVRAATLLAAWQLRQPAEIARMRIRNPYGTGGGDPDGEALVVVVKGDLDVSLLEKWYSDRIRFALRRDKPRVITLEPLRPGDLTLSTENLGIVAPRRKS